jgi:sulfite exporter TauE/SafE
MCGGLVTGLCPDRGQWLRYHAGRLVSYAALGATAGYAGQALLGSETLQFAAWGAAVLMAGAFVAMGVQVWRGKAPHLRLVPAPLVSRAYRLADGAPLILGALSAALPCGWLQSFVVAAAATRSPWTGAALLGAFWLGTLPALAATPWLARTVAKPLFRRAPRAAAILLILAGLGGLGLKISNGISHADAPHSCHDE